MTKHRTVSEILGVTAPPINPPLPRGSAQRRLAHLAKLERFTVYCWTSVAAYAHEAAPDAVCEVIASDPDSAQDSVRSASLGHYEAFETHCVKTTNSGSPLREGMTFEEFRDFHLTRGV